MFPELPPVGRLSRKRLDGNITKVIEPSENQPGSAEQGPFNGIFNT